MPAPPRSASTQFAVRTFRFLGALAVLLALFAVFAMVNGDSNSNNRYRDLIALSIFLGAGALVGLPLAIIIHLRRRKRQT